MKKYLFVFLFLFLSFLTIEAFAQFSWDKSDEDVKVNCNVILAYDLLKGKDHSSIINRAVSANVNNVYRNPLNYCDKILKFYGVVISKPNSLNWDGVKSCEIKLLVDSVPVDMIVFCDTTQVKEGDTVAIYGYPCGILGGKYLQLVGIKKNV